jgi:heme/copper-type cytochrome/quinol oxidase subunit 2
MWGRQFIETGYKTNFNTTFSNNNNEILLHLTQWQYWWWFWFIFFWCLYYVLIYKVGTRRILKDDIVLATTVRSHGNWGDYILCLIPLSWCANILINSTFLLKVIEWQTNSALITLRVRGKQWYWVYKFDLDAIYNILTRPLSVGNDRWFFIMFGEAYTAEDYDYLIYIKNKSSVANEFWKLVFLRPDILNKSFNTDYGTIDYYYWLYKPLFNIIEYSSHQTNRNDWINIDPDLNLGKKCFTKLCKNISECTILEEPTTSSVVNDSILEDYSELKYRKLSVNFKFERTWKDINLTLLDNPSDRWLKKDFNIDFPMKIFDLSNDVTISDIENTLQENQTIIKNYFKDGGVRINKKKTFKNEFLNLKQKRAKTKDSVKVSFLDIRNNSISVKSCENVFLDGSVKVDKKSLLKEIKLLKKLKKRSDIYNLPHNKRLLRLRRTLVLPTQTFLTIVTSSYDVIHSWFVPGLGLKMDCIPGRSTHHTFYIANPGFYYGQCAEVCGRYHHHMPIRVCALDYDQFLVWWNYFGIHRIILLNYEMKSRYDMFDLYEDEYQNKAFMDRKFIW